jgi:hypothetical protein
VQDEEGRSGARFENARVKAHLLPGGKLLGLALGQLGFHGKVSAGQIESRLQFAGCRHLAPEVPDSQTRPTETLNPLENGYVTMNSKACQPREKETTFFAVMNLKG